MESREFDPSENSPFTSLESNEAQKVPPSLLFHQRINRRDVLKLGLIGAAGLALSKDTLFSPFEAKAESSNLAVESFQSELEGKYDIVIDTLKETMDETGDTYFLEDPTAVPNVPWSIDQLSLLDDCLTLLPGHMYEPDDQGTMHITLMPEESSPCRCAGLEYENEHFPQILFIDKYFTQEDFDGSLSFLAHELTHHVTKEFEHQANPNVDQALGESYTEKRPEMILTLREVKKPLYDKVKELDKEFDDEGEKHLSKEEYDKYKFYKTLEIGLGVSWYELPTSDFPDEFVAVMAEHYLHGKNYFFENYGEILNKDSDGEAVEGLYSYMKDVFQDTEYASLPASPQQNTA